MSASISATASTHVAQSTSPSRIAQNSQAKNERGEVREHDGDRDDNRAASQAAQVKANPVTVASGALGNNINTHA